MFRIDENFNSENLFYLKTTLQFFKSRKKSICLDIRDAKHHNIILELIEFADAIKVKYEYVKDRHKLSELLQKASKLNIPVILYLKTSNLRDFIELYRSSECCYPNMFKVVNIEKISPLDIVGVIHDESVYLLDCPICVADKLGVQSCTSGILDIFMKVRKVGRKIKFEEVNQAEQANFFKKSQFCRNCICGCRCLGNKLDTVTPNVITRNESMYASATEIFEQYAKQNQQN